MRTGKTMGLRLGSSMLSSCETDCCAQYRIAMLAAGFGTPIVLTVLGYVPFVSGLLTKLRPYLVWPSTIGTYQVRPLPFLLGNAPTVGQSLYVAMFALLNVILTAVNFHSRQPNAWYSSTWRYAASGVPLSLLGLHRDSC